MISVPCGVTGRGAGDSRREQAPALRGDESAAGQKTHFSSKCVEIEKIVLPVL